MTVPADLDRRFRETAARSQLLDAAYDVIDSELGPLLAAVLDSSAEAARQATSSGVRRLRRRIT